MTRRHDDAGSITVVVLLIATALFALGGLVLDVGRAITARQRAINHAEQAARAGAAALSERDLRAGQLQPDPAAARTAALAFLRRTGETGAVTVRGNQVTVAVRSSLRTSLLGLIGVHSIAIVGQATARPIRTLGSVP